MSTKAPEQEQTIPSDPMENTKFLSTIPCIAGEQVGLNEMRIWYYGSGCEPSEELLCSVDAAIRALTCDGAILDYTYASRGLVTVIVSPLAARIKASYLNEAVNMVVEALRSSCPLCGDYNPRYADRLMRNEPTEVESDPSEDF